MSMVYVIFAVSSIALWLVPSPKQIDLLEQVMTIQPTPLSKPLSLSSYVSFTPHITLASIPGFSITEISALQGSLDSLLKASEALHVRFRALTVGGHYFRSVYLAIHPTSELVTLHEHICIALRNAMQSNVNHDGVQPKAPMFPHMSLCYIADEDAEERERMAMALRHSGKIEETEGSVRLRCEGGETLDGFNGEDVWIVRCQGRPDEWEVLQKIHLSV
ncbi:hypothetical protein SERLA73DRAFT_154935 [Serpula lacrymans var. lacrymans S7.3]|uniref:2',3'-cyclic-nucleotide 3'-phosphodiesterase n=2 Tax=Serpula lacrymans var. lacrymans TaxID=341189 RepID=F8Q7M2_SERL3|nr:uncharacterized protein SERLADRAFT_410601 [Serpula lacrymans var. lacrymans S7.9]EGN95560.1 hypothetical protein SERLA73DRAFT_154935 [Serpula lacrymans var. lacrymans S7.3]EGO21088.1 hypothetical protein SERLADRAFT_410601 [Serpula lacrymans var. lacrymans S7.9]